jgi:hypothetical protein
MNLKSVFALLAAGTFLAACGADEVVNVNDEAKDKATITLKVMDNHDGSAIEEAEVYSIVDDKTVKTNEFGLSVWKKQVIGDHAFQVSKEGYATVLTKVALDEQGQGNVARVGDAIATVAMYKTGVTAKGTVLYTDDKGNKNAASEVTVFATLPANFVPSELSTKTDKNGEYTFKDLPEGTVINISVGQKEFDKKNYALVGDETVGGPTYRAGDVVNVDIMTMSKVAAQLQAVSNNLDKIDTTTSLTFTFSTELADSSKTTWAVNSGSVLVNATVDKKTVTVKPVSGKWEKGSTYTVSGTVYSTDGAKLNVSSLSFTVGSNGGVKAPDNVTNFKAVAGDYSDEVDLSWTAPKVKIAGYRLYYKTDLMADYEYAESYSASATKATIETDYDIYVPTTAKEISFILLPYVNGTSGKPVEADVTKATAAKFTIGSKPASSSSVAVVPTSSEDIVPTSSEDEEEP